MKKTSLQLFQEGRRCFKEGKSRKALSCYQGSLKQLKIQYQMVLQGCVDVYYEQEQFKKAIPVALESVKLLEEVYGKTSYEATVAAHELAGLYACSKQAKKAEIIQKRVVKLCEQKMRCNDSRLDSIYEAMGGIYFIQKKYDLAAKFFKKQLSSVSHHKGRKHPDTYAPFVNLLNVWKRQKKTKLEIKKAIARLN